MQLRSGVSFWNNSSPLSLEFAPLSGDSRCSVLVLGGGITGALVAYHLIRDGASVILLDQREIGQGSTAASTGLLQYEVDTPLCDLIKQVGVGHAVHAYRRGVSAIDEIEGLVAELGDSCGFVRRDSLYFASSWWHARRLGREFECRREFGFDVEYLTRPQLAAISSIRAAGGIVSHGDAQIDPYRFTQRLVQAAARQGLQVHTRTIASDIQERPDGVTVQTPGGTIQADQIVYATGYASEKHVGGSGGSLESTYAVVSQPGFDVPGWPGEWLMWETARPYFYARKTEDGRAMIGGEDTLFSNDHERDGLVERKIQRLVQRFQRLFPQAAFIPHYAWAGTFASTPDGLAFIGQKAGRPRAYFALGYGGNGITFSVIAARLLADLRAGRPNADAPVFRFGR